MRKKTIPKGHIEIPSGEIVDRTTPEGKRLFDTLSSISKVRDMDTFSTYYSNNEECLSVAFEIVGLLEVFSNLYTHIKQIPLPQNDPEQKKRQERIENIKAMIIGYLEDLKDK